MIKRFLEWISLKFKLHSNQAKAPFVSEGELWWAALGENIGQEINGKSEKFTRPVIIYKKLSRSFFLVVPASTKLKTGSWYVPYEIHGRKACASLHQIRAIDHRRLYSRLGELNKKDFKRLKYRFQKLYR